MTKKKKTKVKGQKLSSKDLQREVLKLYRRHPRKQFNPRQVIKKLKIANNKDAVQHAIEQLVESKDLIARDNYKYQANRDKVPAHEKNTAIGKVDMTRSGAAYILIEDVEEDIYVAPHRVNNALNGDLVKIRFWKPRGRFKAEGEILEVLERATDHFVGIYQEFGRFGLVRIEGRQEMDLIIALNDAKDAKSGEMVVVKIKEDAVKIDRYENPVGEVTAILGQPGSSNLDMQAILINNGFNIEFPPEVVKESEALDETITEEEIARRRDIRDVLTFTIDPLTAKDFDDALSYRALEDDRFEIGIHIADVSHYVKPKTALDAEAYKRSTSVYLVDRVCPMLPEKLSNELCSLRPHEDKLAFSAIFVFDKNFKVRQRWFGKTVIHSDRRFTYEEAQKVIDTSEGDHVEELQLLNKVAHKLRERRFKHGSIDFASEEVRFKLDEDGTPIEVYVKERLDAHMLVEDFMLLANREVAGYIGNKEKRRNVNIPFVYRVHDDPDPDKAMELALFAKALGFEMDVSTPEAISKSYNRLLKAAETDHQLKLLAPLAIRTMAKAKYTTENVGHYGLGFAHYSHFTSPIRRYSDVLAHRILEQNLPKGSLYTVNGNQLEEQCKHISSQERKATDAERESIKYKQVEFMENHVGEEFMATVNGLTDFGVFAEINTSRCEGMISYDHMDQAYRLGEGRLSIIGTRTGAVIRMGDVIKVRVLDTDRKRRRIDLALVELPEHGLTERRTDRAKSSERRKNNHRINNSKSKASHNPRRKQNNSKGSSGNRSRKGGGNKGKSSRNGRAKS